MATSAKIVVAAIFMAFSMAGAVSAQTIYENGYMPAPDAYANLPGVKDPRTLQPKERYNCHSTTVTSSYPDGEYRDTFGSRGLPVQGYRCTGSAGSTVTGTGDPISKDWYPGINPRTF